MELTVMRRIVMIRAGPRKSKKSSQPSKQKAIQLNKLPKCKKAWIEVGKKYCKRRSDRTWMIR